MKSCLEATSNYLSVRVVDDVVHDGAACRQYGWLI